jgi:lactobin A/cerein 7B family class IIb bacteriocin
MKKLELSNFGVQELDATEIQEKNGGVVEIIFAVFGGIGAVYGTGYAIGRVAKMINQL